MLFTREEIKETNEKTLKEARELTEFRVSQLSPAQREAYYKYFQNPIQMDQIEEALDMIERFVEYNKKVRK